MPNRFKIYKFQFFIRKFKKKFHHSLSNHMKQNRGQENYGKTQKEKLKRQLETKFANSYEYLKNIFLEEKINEV